MAAPISQVVTSQVWSDYIDPAEAAAYLQMPSTPTGPTLTILQRVISAACSWAQNYCNRPVAPTEFRERHDGWGGDTIMLKQSPFLKLVSATEWQSVGGPIELLESTPDNPIDGVQINYATSQLTRVFAGYSWPRPYFPGRRNIEVIYIAGFNPIPPDLWIGTMELVAWWWRNTQQASRGPIIRRGEYDPGETSSDNGLWQGVPFRVEAMISPYRKISFA